MENKKEAPKVTAAEVADLEEKFRKAISPLVKFDIQDNGFSMKFYNGESGIDASWSGTIILKADNYIKWSYSMLNGVFIESKFNIDESNKNIIANLYDFFIGWKEEISTTITEPDINNNPERVTNPDETSPQDVNPAQNLAGPESLNVPQPNVGQLAENESLIIKKDNSVSRKNYKRESVIMDSAERMRRLAGLK